MVAVVVREWPNQEEYGRLEERGRLIMDHAWPEILPRHQRPKSPPRKAAGLPGAPGVLRTHRGPPVPALQLAFPSRPSLISSGASTAVIEVYRSAWAIR